MEISEILRDLNITIADVESAMIANKASRNRADYQRAIGQLKAARTSLIAVLTASINQEVR